MNIRRARMRDVDALMELEAASFTTREMTNRDTLLFRIRNYDQWFFVAEERDKILAYISCRPVQGRTMRDSFYTKQKVREETSLAILSMGDQSEEGRALYPRLLRHIMDLAKIRGIKTLLVACKEPMRPFFTDVGFTAENKSAISFSPGFETTFVYDLTSTP